MFTRFNSKLPARPESIEAVLKVLLLRAVNR
jgi:hypothetical protein